jgi:predicted metal-dependent phosphoesterase TrpH
VYPIPRLRPLLCELHAHTTWSDGTLALHELVDLYGQTGFDVLCVTDHVLPEGSPPYPGHGSIVADNFGAYLAEIEAEAERAESAYGMLVLPGVELTVNDDDPDRAAHAVAVGLHSYVRLGDSLEEALCQARSGGAALIAAHPHAEAEDTVPGRTTRRFWLERDELSVLVDRFELFNRETLFAWVSENGLPHVAAGDFHRPRHLAGWKTLLPCERHEETIVAYLRSPRPVMLARLSMGLGAELREAA